MVRRHRGPGRNLGPNVDLDLVARRTPGFTGADLANVMNEAVLLAIRSGTDGARITQTNLSEAISRVLHGPHRGKLMSAPERERITVHESGHAPVAAAVGRAAQVDRVSIVARARGLGQSMLSNGDRVLLTGDELESELAVDAVLGQCAPDVHQPEAVEEKPQVRGL